MLKHVIMLVCLFVANIWILSDLKCNLMNKEELQTDAVIYCKIVPIVHNTFLIVDAC